MANATILLAPSEIHAKVCFSNDALVLIRSKIDNYVPAGTITVKETGEDAAEEMFDLTNNPSRQLERANKYGRGRSVSSGDVIDVDGVKYACMSFGWKVL